MREVPDKESDGEESRPRSSIRDCSHATLTRVEESGINDVDTDVLIYACSRCGKTFTVSDS